MQRLKKLQPINQHCCTAVFLENHSTVTEAATHATKQSWLSLLAQRQLTPIISCLSLLSLQAHRVQCTVVQAIVMGTPAGLPFICLQQNHRHCLWHMKPTCMLSQTGMLPVAKGPQADCKHHCGVLPCPKTVTSTNTLAPAHMSGPHAAHHLQVAHQPHMKASVWIHTVSGDCKGKITQLY